MRMPRWLSVIFGVFFFSVIYYGAPLGLSLQSEHHLWLDGHPTWANELGLVGVIGGAVLLLWVQIQHFENAPKGWRLGNPFEGQGYVLTSGPYRFCRHTMHIATTAIWFGWALFYGSVDIAVAASVILLMVLIFVPAEERGIEAKLGEEYRQYRARVPRRPWQSRRP